MLKKISTFMDTIKEQFMDVFRRKTPELISCVIANAQHKSTEKVSTFSDTNKKTIMKFC
ncbi:MAG: hypothetical protein PQJ46_00455 [Spirochaetales bacterium]|nr:hypothetical protein [Spirochaetales bacterium]